MKLQIGPLRADGVNLLANDFVAGLPSPGAALGFAGALLRYAGVEDWSHEVLMILHSVDLRKGRQRAHPAAKGGIPENIEIKEGLFGSAIFTMVIDTPYAVSNDSLSRSLNLMRFAGGVITPYQRNGNRDLFLLDQRVEILDSNAMLSDLNLPRGYALCPQQTLPGKALVSFGDYSTLSMIRDRGYSHQKGQGWHVPVACGYRLLEDPHEAKPRRGSRCGYKKHPHVFAEPAVGLGEFISIRNQSLLISISELNRYMWKWSCDFDRRLIMFSTAHLHFQTQEELQ